MANVKDEAKKQAAKQKKKVGGFLAEFKEFALKGNVMSMAVGVLIGGAFSGLVTSLTENIINPILNCFGNVSDSGVASLSVEINGQVLQFGAFIADVVNFIILAFIVFLLVKGMNKLLEAGKKEEEAKAPDTKECPYCKSSIPVAAIRCPHCTSELKDVKDKKQK